MRWSRPQDGEEGSLSVMVAIMAVPMLIMVGLVFDGGQAVRARGRAVAYAEEASRAGAQGIDPLQATALALDPATAAQRVAAYCAQAKAADPTLTGCALDGPVGTNCVVVRATVTVQTDLLGLIDINSLSGSGVGRASAVQGVTAPDQSAGCP